MYKRAFNTLREGRPDDKEEAVMVLEAWRKLEQQNVSAAEPGSATAADRQAALQAVEKRMPRRVKRKRPIITDDGLEAGMEVCICSASVYVATPREGVGLAFGLLALMRFDWFLCYISAPECFVVHYCLRAVCWSAWSASAFTRVLFMQTIQSFVTPGGIASSLASRYAS